MNKCNICGGTMREVPAGTRKDGSTYDSFIGCDNFKNHPKKVEKPQTQLDRIEEKLDRCIEFMVQQDYEPKN